MTSSGAGIRLWTSPVGDKRAGKVLPVFSAAAGELPGECISTRRLPPAQQKRSALTPPFDSDSDERLGWFQLLCLLQGFLCHGIFFTLDAAQATAYSVQS